MPLLLMHPFRRIRFDQTQHVGDGDRRLEIGQQMNVIFDPANLQQSTALLSRYSCYVAVEFLLEFLSDQALSIFRAEQDVIEEIRIRCRHAKSSGGGMISLLRSFVATADSVTRGSRPWLQHVTPHGAHASLVTIARTRR